MGRRNLSPYQVLKQDGIELLLLPQLVMHVRNVDIDLKEFLFFKNLRATLELEDGQVLGRKPSAA